MNQLRVFFLRKDINYEFNVGISDFKIFPYETYSCPAFCTLFGLRGSRGEGGGMI